MLGLVRLASRHLSRKLVAMHTRCADDAIRILTIVELANVLYAGHLAVSLVSATVGWNDP